ncbi:MAG TPA: hypothetical protein VFY35_07860, partial [Burkholderiaceae bacterium]|nr:hypothetical protein [Burkholderiaceae bacterium]
MQNQATLVVCVHMGLRSAKPFASGSSTFERVLERSFQSKKRDSHIKNRLYTALLALAAVAAATTAPQAAVTVHPPPSRGESEA